MYKPQKSKMQIKNQWTDENKIFVLKNAGKMPIQELAKKVGRTIQSTKNMCGNIGVAYAHPDNKG